MQRTAILVAALLLAPSVASAQFGSDGRVRPVPGGLAVNVEGNGAIPAPTGRILVVMGAADATGQIAAVDEALVQRTLIAFGGTSSRAETHASDSPPSVVIFADFAKPTHGLVYAVVEKIRSLTFSGTARPIREAITFWTPDCRAMHERARNEALQEADTLVNNYANQYGLTLGTDRSVTVTLDSPVLKGDICLSGVSIPDRLDPPVNPAEPYMGTTLVKLYVRYDVK
ncbi:MAG TPA: hypothetical protein VMB20_10835 [Candidatus Acidoferrum sp.]|nr:hypothetical protein [Candidatus Acidoferrum sp.]